MQNQCESGYYYELILQVFAFCADQYNQQYIFFVREGEGSIPSSFSSANIMWSSNSEVIETSSTVNNNDMDNTTIDAIAKAVENPDADAGLLIDSIVDEE